MLRSGWWLVAATCIAAAPAIGADAWAPAKKLDAYFDALARNDLTQGSIAISEGGVLRYQRTLGFARIENGRPDPADPVTRYRIGSVTELFTAVMVMQLAENASITLDTPLAEFYPDLPNALKLKYRDLLNHRSGLKDYADEPSFDTWRRKPMSHAQMLELITSRGTTFAPGERVEYSNSNYLVLGYMLEKVYGRPYEEILRRQISDKVGLARTYLAGKGSASLESQSYQPSPDGSWELVPGSDPSILAGAGGLVSTARDLVMFMDALVAEKLVMESSLTSMLNQDGGSGIGLWPYEIAGQSGFGHRGRVDGFRACVYRFPQRKLSIAFTSNASLLPIDELVDEVLTIVFRGDQPPAFVPVKLSDRQQAEYLGTWSTVEGQPRRSPFRTFRAPASRIELQVMAGTDTPVLRMADRAYPLVAFGGDEFLSRELSVFLRFYPRSGEMVSRGPDWAYYFKRAK